jgi:hypothetical protein
MCFNKTHVLKTYDDNKGTFVSMKMTSSTVRDARPAGLMTFRDVSENNPLVT